MTLSPPKNDALGPGLYISRGSTFATQKDNEELLRSQIEASVVYSTNLQEWDGKKWIPKYFVLTTSRVLVLSLALHLYDEEPDILGSFATRDIIEVKSCGDNDCVDIGSAHTAMYHNSSPIKQPQQQDHDCRSSLLWSHRSDYF
ncbi:hypothetical protein PINS_up017308 [Pythium insidiosum]|nr:hypothetical protein PINS_up017308 [Pythium insidiosum]